ncbi:hypothetical protein KI387_037903 [Taxus chinensis]|uniref:GATA-type domain-containing protein n=1 Tax=Taxus chinensis TaxID=29808 RepID=A0AA38FSS6_TAXCH|nr:hypothetical protein KI387_037903 [Taxus chinensis]
MHKFRLQSLRRLLRTDSDSQIAVNRGEKTTEAEFSDGSVTRTCSDCKTDKTPLWRNGPNGPKSLCNACGIRYKKIAKQLSASNADDEGDVGHKKTPTKLSSVRQMKLIKRKRDTAELRSCDTAAPRKKNTATFMAAPPTTVALLTNRGFSNDERRSSTTNRGYSNDERRSSFLSGGSFAEDEEEGAVLLMGLSCGLVNA